MIDAIIATARLLEFSIRLILSPVVDSVGCSRVSVRGSIAADLYVVEWWVALHHSTSTIFLDLVGWRALRRIRRSFGRLCRFIKCGSYAWLCARVLLLLAVGGVNSHSPLPVSRSVRRLQCMHLLPVV